MNNEFKSGFVTIIGRPNVGKSTLMNALVGEKVAIVSNKPQTTRNQIKSILTGDDFQVVFIDTPGIHNPGTKLGTYMVKAAENTLNAVDLIIYITEPDTKPGKTDKMIIERLNAMRKSGPGAPPVYLVINKIDMIEKPEVLKVIDAFKDLCAFDQIVPISALKQINLDRLTELIKGSLVPGPKYFPEDMLTDQPERQLVAEILREKALRCLQDEVPHGVAVEILSMKHRKDESRKGGGLMDIEATMYCERDTHKGIIIGKSGAMLKRISTNAREDIEALLGIHVNLQVWVRVKKDWRNSDFYLKNFGYNEREIE